jgi:hypothetical protein
VSRSIIAVDIINYQFRSDKLHNEAILAAGALVSDVNIEKGAFATTASG